MGIQGLLPAIRERLHASHVRELSGRRVAVDAYAWIHKGSYGCCVELCTGEKTDKWLQYCLGMVDLLLSHDVQVTLVFDGADLPAKKTTEASRSSHRKENLEKGLQCLQRKDIEQARKHLAAAVNVTPRMAAELILTLRALRPQVKCYVAPYEADAMLAYLIRYDFVDTVISEDSDMIPYGCRDIVFKLDRGGACQRLELSTLFSNPIEGFDLTSFDQDMLISMCILAGCDYLPSLKGFGIKNSYKLVVKHRSPDKILRTLRLQGLIPLVCAESLATTKGGQLLAYELNFHRAFATFHHQTIYNLLTRRLDRLSAIAISDLPSCLKNYSPDEWDFLGTVSIEPSVAEGVAGGLLHPESKERFALDEPPIANKSIPQPTSEVSAALPARGSGFHIIATKGETISGKTPSRKRPVSLLEKSTSLTHMEAEKENQVTNTHGKFITRNKVRMTTDKPSRSPYFVQGFVKSANQSVQDLIQIRKNEAKQRLSEKPKSIDKTKIESTRLLHSRSSSNNKEIYISQFSSTVRPKLVGDKLVQTSSQTLKNFFPVHNRDSLASQASRQSGCTDLETISPVGPSPQHTHKKRFIDDSPNYRSSENMYPLDIALQTGLSDSLGTDCVVDLTSDSRIVRRDAGVASAITGPKVTVARSAKNRQSSVVDFFK